MCSWDSHCKPTLPSLCKFCNVPILQRRPWVAERAGNWPRCPGNIRNSEPRSLTCRQVRHGCQDSNSGPFHGPQARRISFPRTHLPWKGRALFLLLRRLTRLQCYGSRVSSVNLLKPLGAIPVFPPGGSRQLRSATRLLFPRLCLARAKAGCLTRTLCLRYSFIAVALTHTFPVSHQSFPFRLGTALEGRIDK